MSPRRAAAASCAVFALWAGAARASTWEFNGFGPRAAGLGNASEAASDDYFATYANPANLALARHVHGGFGFDVLRHAFAIEQRGGRSRHPPRLPQDNQLVHVGLSTPLGGWLDERAGLGLAFQLPLAGPTRLDALDYRTPHLTLYDSLPDRLELAIGLGVRPHPALALGVSVQMLTALVGQASIDLSILDHRITRKAMDVALTTQVFPIAGATWLPLDPLRVSLVWRAESLIRYGLPLDVWLEEVGRLRFRIGGVGLYLPEVWALAAAWRTSGGWMATAGVAWQRWSGMPPLAPTVDLDLDDREIVRRGVPADSVLFVRNHPIEMGARDVWVPRAGVEWQGRVLAARGGVQHRPTPLPRADGIGNYLDAPATTVSLGVGARFADPLAVHDQPLSLDLTLAWTQLARRTVEKRDPADPVGGTSVAGGSLHAAVGIHHDF
ncbi:MAG: hypothetical protein EXR79_02115 [Myxococcales bacterium]|nr:hypothetical protein [Myxococcales bacterium]